MARNQKLQVWIDYREQGNTPKGKEISAFMDVVKLAARDEGISLSSGWYNRPGISDPQLQRYMEVPLRGSDRVMKFHKVMTIVMILRSRFPTEVKIKCNLRAPTKLAHIALLTGNRLALSEHAGVTEVGRIRLLEEPRLTYRGKRIMRTWAVGEYSAARRVESNLRRILGYSSDPIRTPSVERTMDHALAPYGDWLWLHRSNGMGYGRNETDAAAILELEDGSLHVIMDPAHKPISMETLTETYPDDLWERPELNRPYFKVWSVLDLTKFPAPVTNTSWAASEWLASFVNKMSHEGNLK